MVSSSRLDKGANNALIVGRQEYKLSVKSLVKEALLAVFANVLHRYIIRLVNHVKSRFIKQATCKCPYMRNVVKSLVVSYKDLKHEKKNSATTEAYDEAKRTAVDKKFSFISVSLATISEKLISPRSDEGIKNPKYQQEILVEFFEAASSHYPCVVFFKDAHKVSDLQRKITRIAHDNPSLGMKRMDNIIVKLEATEKICIY